MWSFGLLSGSALLIEQTPDGVVTVTLNRPDMHNALDDAMMLEITRTFDMLGSDSFCRMAVLKANGLSFCAGADIGWMQKSASHTREQNVADAQVLAAMMHTLYTFPKPLVGLVQGAAVGGGVGMVSCCDIVVASDAASFRLSEVKLGIVPAVISPYVVRAVGSRAAQRYFLTAEPFSATEAKNLGLIHEIVPERMIPAASAKLIERLMAGGPKAQRTAKELLHKIEPVEISDDVVAYTTELIADLRASPEGQEGLKAFLEKRQPNWPKR
jgi:methylglutaconyl-CoA hydratase